ncbi:type VII secretion system-associated protein [Streptomyces coelicoflavus]|uniref:type VII secretion system-associated protein n=1 Tax=Streptomyces coelicoflavus TaxID=285562 RepID=UPI002E265754
MTSPAQPPADETASAPRTPLEETPPSGPDGSPAPDEWLPVVLRGQAGFREPPPQFVTAARLAPDHWLTLVDRHWDDADDGVAPPHWALLGRWRSDEHGEIVGWERNPRYRPSPDAHGWGPSDGIADEAARLVATGYDPGPLLVFSLLEEDIAVCLDEQRDPDVIETADGTKAVPVFTVPSDQEVEVPPYAVMGVLDLLDRLPEERDIVFLSSSAPVYQLVRTSSLRAAADVMERHSA